MELFFIQELLSIFFTSLNSKYNHTMQYLKYKMINATTFSLFLAAGHLGVAKSVYPVNELGFLGQDPCSSSEESLREWASLPLAESLYNAVMRNDIETAKRLIDAGADMNVVVGNSRYSAYRQAVYLGNLEMVALLIEKEWC